MRCDKCKRKDWCDSHSMEYDSCVMGGFSDYLPLTNADRIRGMSDEELANFLWQDCGMGNCPPVECKGKRCKAEKCWLDWLKQEAIT